MLSTLLACLNEIDWLLIVMRLAVAFFLAGQVAFLYWGHELTSSYHRIWYPWSKQQGVPFICWLFPLVRAVLFMGMGHWPSDMQRQHYLGSFLLWNGGDENMDLMPLVLYGIQILLSWTISFVVLTSKKLDAALLQLILMDTATAFGILLSCHINLEVTYWIMDQLHWVVMTGNKFFIAYQIFWCGRPRQRFSLRHLARRCG